MTLWWVQLYASSVMRHDSCRDLALNLAQRCATAVTSVLRKGFEHILTPCDVEHSGFLLVTLRVAPRDNPEGRC